LRGGSAPPPQEDEAPEDTPVAPRGRIAWQHARRDAALLEVGPKVAVIATFSCLNAGADFCATCVERCPEPGALRLDGRRVVVDADVCNGCGVCVPLCPAPGGAILLKPAV
ncbi:MAG: 4Fe-4S binding protein, partial [Myxococcota bacterium]